MGVLLRLGMRRLRWVADGGASEAEPRALHGAERLVVVRGEAELLGVGPRLDVFPRQGSRTCRPAVVAPGARRAVRSVKSCVSALCDGASGFVSHVARLPRLASVIDRFDSSLKITAGRAGRSSLAGPALTPEPQRARYKPTNRDGPMKPHSWRCKTRFDSGRAHADRLANVARCSEGLPRRFCSERSAVMKDEHEHGTRTTRHVGRTLSSMREM